ncbi:zf-RVT domain-containing protein, partial [Cephalotus follicularis]
ICSSLRIHAGSLPVRYLGLPLDSKRLSAMDCKCLSLKLVDKIQSWTSKCLSYSGRLQLIQATLLGIQNFWINNAFIPKATMLECEKIMRVFLWSSSTAKRRAKDSWATICTPKAEGGLGLRRVVDCNRAAMLRLIWDIFKDRQSLWSLSITWKCLLDLRAQASANLVYSIGNGSFWSIWYDPWFQSTSLVTRLGYRAIYESGLSRNATLSKVISDSAWNWLANVRQLREISNACVDIPIGQCDVIDWQVKGRSFSFKSAWEAIRAPHPEVPWAKIVWFPGAIPKHSFCLWLSFHRAHNTMDKMQRLGFVQSSQCPFNCGQDESLNHLFF